MDMKVTFSMTGSSVDPNIFGPPLWFTLHNGAVLYPKNPTEYVKQGMKQFISNLPLMIPCLTCREHFYNLLRRTNLDAVVYNRESLFTFWVNAHNQVNARYGKRQFTLDEAKHLYGYENPGFGSKIRITFNGIDPTM